MDQISRIKWRRELKTNLSKMGTAWLNAQLDEWFDYAYNIALSLFFCRKFDRFLGCYAIGLVLGVEEN